MNRGLFFSPSIVFEKTRIVDINAIPFFLPSYIRLSGLFERYTKTNGNIRSYFSESDIENE